MKTEVTLEVLIENLKKLDSIQKLRVNEDGYINDTGFTTVKVEGLVNHLLATPPSPKLSYIRALREAGFDCYAGERDSFGWLTGVIELPSGRKLAFG